MRTQPISAAALGLLLLAVPASAHNTVQTDDGAYFITIGHLNEPVTTWMNSGLDLTVRVNADGEPGDEVPDVHQTMAATFIAPGGEEMEGTLQTQHGQVGRYSFTDPYYLTEAGQYRLRLVGTIGDTTVDGTYNVSGPIDALSAFTFPDQAPTPDELDASIAGLEERVADLQAENEALRARVAALEDTQGDRNGIPGASLTGALAVLAAGAWVARRT